MPIPVGDRPFDALAAELVADQFAAMPTLGSSLGLTEYDELLPDMSADAVGRRQAAEDAWSQRLSALSDTELTPEERIDRDLVVMVLTGRRLLRDWADWRRSADYYAGVALNGVFSLLLHRLRPEDELARAVTARLSAAPELLEQGRANLDADLASPQLLRRSLAQVRAGAAYARAVAAEFPDPGHRAQVAAAGEVAAAAFDAFADHVDALAEKARGSWAIGEQRYDALLRHAEGLGYGAREMREHGQAAYDEIVADMRARTAQLRGGNGHDGDWRALLQELNQDHPATPDELLEEYRQATAQARQFCIDRDLVTVPEGEQCAVVPSAPFTRGMLAVAHYIQPPPFSGRALGHFFVPYPPEGATEDQVRQRMATNSRNGLWSITVHEAYPGHHWHFAWLAAGQAVGRTRPLRSVFGSTYFVEGWGLYSEDLMREQGFFRTREQELCQRDMRLFRAARIVVDTSLHLGEMSVDQAVEHMSTKASLSAETARAEVLRYCAWPTQAASYLTGALEIARMRDRWLAEGRGSLREFHDRAAGSGRLPIALVERSLFDARGQDRGHGGDAAVDASHGVGVGAGTAGPSAGAAS
ncbi:MAG: DUF885 domain-containing protein [Actinomycetota bacterium]|nr:DUF885 domain-containing protein [Actinomycetota bacterium]